MTHVVNIYHKIPYDVYIGRQGKGQDGYFGNPVVAGQPCPFCDEIHRLPGDTLPCFRAYMEFRVQNDEEFASKVKNLAGKTLGCFCKPKPCHGDVIVEWIERLQVTTKVD